MTGVRVGGPYCAVIWSGEIRVDYNVAQHRKTDAHVVTMPFLLIIKTNCQALVSDAMPFALTFSYQYDVFLKY